MAVTPTRVYGPAQPGTSTAVLATVAASKRWIVKQVLLANTTGAAASVTLGIGGTAAANQIVPAVLVPANDVETIDMTLVMTAAETLNGLQGTSAAVTVTVTAIVEDV